MKCMTTKTIESKCDSSHKVRVNSSAQIETVNKVIYTLLAPTDQETEH